jgi:hypothetical protein
LVDVTLVLVDVTLEQVDATLDEADAALLLSGPGAETVCSARWDGRFAGFRSMVAKIRLGRAVRPRRRPPQR